MFCGAGGQPEEEIRPLKRSLHPRHDNIANPTKLLLHPRSFGSETSRIET